MTAAKKKNSAKKTVASKKPAAKKSAPPQPKKILAKKISPKAKSKSSLSLLKFPRPSLVSQLSGGGERLSPRLQAVIDKSDITDVLTKFARGIDRIDENLLRSVLHHDATLDLGPGVFQGTSGDYVRWVLGVLQGIRSSHHLIGNVRVELEGDAALVESYFHAHIRIEKPIGREDVFMGGRNLDRFERRPSGSAGVWKIMHRKQILDWVRTQSASDIFYHQNPDALWSYRTKTDASYHMAQFPGTQAGGKLPAFLGRHYESKSVKF
ncbi:MAG: nuclear transport factor 2 family protein [Alphaproteobacteria bacterium]|nr:nuclear transport factor 2 family protein [Alphaproteobacteria bacterium]